MKFDPVDTQRPLEFHEANLFVLRANALNADPVPASDLKDGDIWYRGDLNVFKAKVNGTIQSLSILPGNIISGTVGTVDVGSTTGSLSVTGNLISATASVPSSAESAIAITYPSVGSNFMPIITIEGTGNPSLDGDLKGFIIHTITDTSLIITLDEGGTVVQSLVFHVLLWPIA